MIRLTYIIDSLSKLITDNFPDFELHILNPVKNEFKPEDKMIYLLVEEGTRETQLDYYEKRTVLCQVFHKIHDSQNYSYYNFIDDFRYKVLKDQILIDPKLRDPDITEPSRYFTALEISETILETNIVAINFSFLFEDIFRYDEEPETLEEIIMKEEVIK